MDLSDAGLRERAKIIAAELVALFAGRNAMSPLILSELCDIRDAAMASQRERDAKIAEEAYMPGTDPQGEWQRACRNAAAAIRVQEGSRE